MPYNEELEDGGLSQLLDESWKLNKKNVLEFWDEMQEFDDYSYPNKKPDNIGGGWQYQIVERVGGGEGGGETHYVVFCLSKGDIKSYWQVDGWYQSYHGAELDGTPYEVEPKEVMVIQYHKKKNKQLN